LPESVLIGHDGIDNMVIKDALFMKYVVVHERKKEQVRTSHAIIAFACRWCARKEHPFALFCCYFLFCCRCVSSPPAQVPSDDAMSRKWILPRSTKS
jgi:hypothetical protein